MAKKKTTKTEEVKPLPKIYQEQADKRLEEREKALLERSETTKEIEPETIKVEKMSKFIFTTMTSSMTSYTGPSGISYQIDKDQPFIVQNKQDIEFFEKNKRFAKQSFLKKMQPKKDTSENDLRKELLEIEGLGEDTIEVVVDIYMNKKTLIDVLEQGNKLDSSISAEEQELIFNHYFPEPVVEEQNEVEL